LRCGNEALALGSGFPYQASLELPAFFFSFRNERTRTSSSSWVRESGPHISKIFISFIYPLKNLLAARPLSYKLQATYAQIIPLDRRTFPLNWFLCPLTDSQAPFKKADIPAEHAGFSRQIF
jgi:hypothetical protein